MRAWAARHRRFLVFSASTLLLLGALAGLHALYGDRIVAAAYEGRSIKALNRYFEPRGRELARLQARTTGSLRSLLLVALALHGLVAVLYFLGRRPRRKLWMPIGVLAWWLGVETFVAPRLAFPLWTRLYSFVRDPDHRPTYTSGEYNSDSLRGTPEPEAFREEDLNLVFLGDSFTLGAGVRADEAFPILVGERSAAHCPGTPVHVANFGWLSSSPLLSHRRLVDLGAKYRPDVVVLAVDMTDFEDDLRYERMLARDGLYWWYDKLPLSLRILQETAPDAFRELLTGSLGGIPDRRFFMTEAPLEETRAWLAPLVGNVESIAGWCREHGAEFVLVVLPRTYQYTELEPRDSWEAFEYVALGEFVHEPFRFFEEYARTAPFPVVSLLEDFRTTPVFPTAFDNDPHWNPDGHRVAAEAIARALAGIVERRLEN